jgi:TolA-binding protein
MLVRQFLLSALVISGCMAFGDDLARQNQNRIAALQRMVLEQNERIDGLTSLIEGLSASVAELKMAQQHSPSGSESNETRKLIRDLGVMIDKINADYVSRDELSRMLKGAKGTAPVSKKQQKRSAAGSDALSHVPASKLYSEGVRLFVKKRYAEAEKRFMLTAQKGYKPAASNYYLGEIAYYTKQYSDAIFYYKKSAGLYDKASYMDVLLLHTAVSLERTGKKQQAKVFYENVVESYPGRKAASIAKGKLRKL